MNKLYFKNRKNKTNNKGVALFGERHGRDSCLENSMDIILPGEFHGQRDLAGYSPRGRRESDTTERLTHTNTHSEPRK